jgi:hypothetical protein
LTCRGRAVPSTVAGAAWWRGTVCANARRLTSEGRVRFGGRRSGRDRAGSSGPSRIRRDGGRMWAMPLTGEYEPGTSAWSRAQAGLYEATNGEQAGPKILVLLPAALSAQAANAL